MPRLVTTGSSFGSKFYVLAEYSCVIKALETLVASLFEIYARYRVLLQL